MVSLKVVGGTAYVIASVVFLYWRVQVAVHDAKCPRSTFLGSKDLAVASWQLPPSSEPNESSPAASNKAYDAAASDPTLAPAASSVSTEVVDSVELVDRAEQERERTQESDFCSSVVGTGKGEGEAEGEGEAVVASFPPDPSGPLCAPSASLSVGGGESLPLGPSLDVEVLSPALPTPPTPVHAPAPDTASPTGAAHPSPLQPHSSSYSSSSTPGACTADTLSTTSPSPSPCISCPPSPAHNPAAHPGTPLHLSPASDSSSGAAQVAGSGVPPSGMATQAQAQAQAQAAQGAAPEAHHCSVDRAPAPSTHSPSGVFPSLGLSALFLRWLALDVEEALRLTAAGGAAGAGGGGGAWRSLVPAAPAPARAGGSPVLLSSPLTVLSLLNVLVILAVLLKEVCLGSLSFLESHRLVEMALGYVFVKLIFFVIVLDSTELQHAEWLLLWVCLFGVLKVLERLGKERFQRLTASPSATMVHHMRVLGLLISVLSLDLLMCSFVLPLFPALTPSKILLLSFEPAAVALETTQTLVRYVFHLAEEEFPVVLTVAGKLAPFLAAFLSSGVSGAEWRASLLHHLNALFEVSCTLLTLSHCMHLWHLHSYSFHIIDIVLFLNARSLLGKLVKRGRSFLRWRATLKNLQSALPDASLEDISSFADDCAICKEPMSAAKRLPCGHLFHLSCLRSWLDQGSAASHACPSCRRPLRPGTSATPAAAAAAAGDRATATGTANGNATDQGRLPRDGGPTGAGAPQPPPGNGQDGAVAGVAAAADRPGAEPGAGAGGAPGLAWLVGVLDQWLAAMQMRAEQNAWGLAAAAGLRGEAQLQAQVQMAQGQPAPADARGGAGADVVAQQNAGGFALSFAGLRFRGGRANQAQQQEQQAAHAPHLHTQPQPQAQAQAQAQAQEGPRRPALLWGGHGLWLGSRRGTAAENPEEVENQLVAMAAQVEEILPHLPFNTILQDLRRTRSVMVTVNNLMDPW